MEEKDIVEAFAKGTADAVIQPVADMFKRILGLSVQEFNESMQDRALYKRWKGQVIIFTKMKKLLDKKGLTDIIPIPYRTALPLLEGGVFEEDENLQDKWAALLASAVDPDVDHNFDKLYFDILGQLTSLDVRILDYFYELFKEYFQYCLSYDEHSEVIEVLNEAIFKDYEEYCESLSIELSLYEMAITNIERHRIVKYVPKTNNVLKGDRFQLKISDSFENIMFTNFGYEFVKRCNE